MKRPSSLSWLPAAIRARSGGAPDTNLYVDRALKDILQAVKTGEPSRLDAATVLPGLEILLALFESANQKKMLSLPLKQQETPFVK